MDFRTIQPSDVATLCNLNSTPQSTRFVTVGIWTADTLNGTMGPATPEALGQVVATATDPLRQGRKK